MPASTPLTVTDLTRMSREQLDALFGSSDVGEPITGTVEGVGLSLGPLAASLPFAAIREAVRAVAWQGKRFDAETGGVKNIMSPFRLPLLSADTRVTSDTLDGRPSLVIDFSGATKLPIQDEVRQVGPNLYLGINMVAGRAAAYFAMWPATPKPADYYRGRVALVTGGASGFGRALVQDLAGRGAHVVVADIDEVKAKDVVTLVEAAGGSAEAMAIDVTSLDSVQGVVEDLVRRHGRIDLLFNNAGIQVGGEHHEVGLDAGMRMVDININGVLHGIEAAYPAMIAAGSGHIINTASVAGLTPVPLGALYSATKHFVVGLSTSLRSEAADLGVNVSVVCPGPMSTPFWDAPTVGYDQDKLMKTFAFRDQADPIECAAATLDAVARNQALIEVGGPTGRIAWRAHRVSPNGYLAASKIIMRSFRGNRLGESA
jgi:NADP-dependent 3-hydroxy acid dehydrogenase YdfG